MARVWRYLGQGLAYALFFLPIGYCSNSPVYVHQPADQATIKISLRHSGQLLGECRQRSAEELANLSAMMRAEEVCPRDRSPLTLELDINGEPALVDTLPPRGLHNDGMAAAYRRLPVPAGKVHLRVRMKDHLGQQDFPYQAEHVVDLQPAQVLVIDFDSQTNSFTFM